MASWVGLKSVLPGTLWAEIAPYGAMVSYTKRGSFNAIAHEQAKRLCFNAQEEIYEVNRQQLMAVRQTDNAAILAEMSYPPCKKSDKCPEGRRFCGREMSLRKSHRFEDYFPIRRV
jgi:hypothetical protein